MNLKLRNIIIIIIAGVLVIVIYGLFLKPSSSKSAPLSSSDNNILSTTDNTISQNQKIESDFLSILLSVKSIKLDDSIFSDTAFSSLRDNGITLPSDPNPGRPNPFAPIGSDIVAVPVNVLTNTAVVPPVVDNTIIPETPISPIPNTGTGTSTQ